MAAAGQMSSYKYTQFSRHERTLCTSVVLTAAISTVIHARTSTAMTAFLNGMLTACRGRARVGNGLRVLVIHVAIRRTLHVWHSMHVRVWIAQHIGVLWQGKTRGAIGVWMYRRDGRDGLDGRVHWVAHANLGSYTITRDGRTLCTSVVLTAVISTVIHARTSTAMTAFLNGMAGCILGSGRGREWVESSRYACCCPSHPACLTLDARACLDCAPHSSAVAGQNTGSDWGLDV